MNHRRLFLVLFLLFLAAFAQKPEGKPSPLASQPDYSPESFLVEELRTSYQFANDGTGRKEIYVRIKVQSEAGVEQWGKSLSATTRLTSASKSPTFGYTSRMDGW